MEPTHDYTGPQPAKIDWRWLLRPIVLAALGCGLIKLLDWAHGVSRPMDGPYAAVGITICDNWRLLVLALLLMHGMSLSWLIVPHVRRRLFNGFFALYLTLGIASPMVFLTGPAISHLFLAWDVWE